MSHGTPLATGPRAATGAEEGLKKRGLEAVLGVSDHCLEVAARGTPVGRRHAYDHPPTHKPGNQG